MRCAAAAAAQQWRATLTAHTGVQAGSRSQHACGRWTGHADRRTGFQVLRSAGSQQVRPHLASSAPAMNRPSAGVADQELSCCAHALQATTRLHGAANGAPCTASPSIQSGGPLPRKPAAMSPVRQRAHVASTCTPGRARPRRRQKPSLARPPHQAIRAGPAPQGPCWSAQQPPQVSTAGGPSASSQQPRHARIVPASLGLVRRPQRGRHRQQRRRQD